MQSLTILVAVAAYLGTAHAREPSPPTVCMSSPLAIVTAGQSITASIENPQGRPCEATLFFADDTFLAVTFQLRPVTCLGYQQAEITVPMEVPNGEVTILWECAGVSGQSCSRATIIEGLANEKGLDTQQDGVIGCVVPIATLTTIVTSVQGTATLVSAVVETLFSTSVSAATSTDTPDTSTASWLSSGTSLAPTPLAASLGSTATWTHSSPTSTLTVVPPSVAQDAVNSPTRSETMTGGIESSTCSCSKEPKSTPGSNGSPFS